MIDEDFWPYRQRSIGTEGVATVSQPSKPPYLFQQIVSGGVPVDRQIFPNTPLVPEPPGQVKCSGWQAWVSARRRALTGMGG